MDSAFWGQFWPGFYANLASTILGGILLTVIFFLFKEKFFSLPVVAGVWECETIINETGYNPYRGMKVWYKITLLQSGTSVVGMGEKDREVAAKGAYEYSGAQRRTTDISGSITKRFFGSDEIVIFWREDGQKRETATFFRLRVSGCKRKGGLRGTFYTTAAQSRGEAFWKRIA